MLNRASALIRALLHGSCPPAIRRLVMTVSVDAVKAVFRGWLRPHVREERGEVVGPSLADVNAAPAVQPEMLSVRVKAPGLHGGPRSVFFCEPIARLAVTHSDLANALPLKTSTGLGRTVRQVPTVHVALLPALATTTPESSADSGRGAPDQSKDCPSMVRATREVLEGWHLGQFYHVGVRAISQRTGDEVV